MEDERTIDLANGKKAVIRTRVTMKDKMRASAVAARMMDMTLGDDNQPVIKIDMGQRFELDATLLKLFTVKVGDQDATPAVIDDLDTTDGEAILDAIWDANGDRLGLDRAAGFSTKKAAAIPKESAQN